MSLLATRAGRLALALVVVGLLTGWCVGVEGMGQGERSMTAGPVRRALTNSMLFYPGPRQDRDPRSLGMDFEALQLEAADGLKTLAWWIPAASESAAVLLFFHGNAGTMADRLDNALLLHQLGLTLLMCEYRGYGGNDGETDELGMRADAEAALAEARRRAGGRPVAVFGRSLGGAVAIDLASRQPVDGLLVESTFTSLPDMAERSGIPLARQLVAYDFASVEKIAKVQAPVTIIHGDADEVVPYFMGERLRDAAAASVKLNFLRVAGGTHNDTWLRGGDAYWQTWKDFFLTLSS